MSPFDAGRAYIFNGVTGTLVDSLRSPVESYDGRFGAAAAWAQDVDGGGAIDERPVLQ